MRTISVLFSLLWEKKNNLKGERKEEFLSSLKDLCIKNGIFTDDEYTNRDNDFRTMFHNIRDEMKGGVPVELALRKVIKGFPKFNFINA